MILLLSTIGGDRARVGACQPASQARVLRKLGPHPLEHGTGFGLAPEGVERVGTEPAAAEAQTRLIRGRPGASENLEGTCGILSILEQCLRGPYLHRVV